ncbi:protein phosphatase 2C domain-containing protein [Paenibacillus sp. J2TS4]|uniref:protein phosphatase 2C domain-containing protein n=1 Tax=Paenibacillus sp. J2TS4 TaxID=2807194 RepID=UPI001B28B97E|nr:protein phosphatase 2C domain-containing protein [Paenibacillus sp. J2TS4]GIP34162.1 serine/threonine protein phosphatase [Paenibacillus sp. J2TS4]
MRLNIEQISIQGSNEWNEDALIVREEVHVYGVLDGATSVTPYRGPQGETGGYLASNVVRRELEAMDEQQWAAIHVKDAVLQANQSLREAMVLSGIDPEDREALWTTEVALVRIEETRVQYAQTGDCMILAVYKDGTVRTVTHDQLDHIDLQTRKRWKACLYQGMSSRKEIRAQVEPYIRKNKVLMNTLQGYSAMNGQAELASFLEYGVINRINLTGLLLITDGLFPHSEDIEEKWDAVSLIKEVEEKGLRGYAESLIELEQSDPDCQTYIRFKTSDDKTGIWIRF